MSRYYRIVVQPEKAVPFGGTAPSNNAGAEWTNLVNGKADLGAQMIEIDAWLYALDEPVSAASITIWGPSKQQIIQSSDFNGAHIDVYAGMQKGLPLADAQAPQSGLILSGQIYQAYANWQGINQTLNFVVITDGGATQSNPANISFSWQKGEKLGPAIKRTLEAAYKGVTVNVDISDRLVLPQTDHHVPQTIQQFASYIKGVSQDILGGDYQGVSITRNGDVISVFDNSAPPATTTAIQVQDLIGQPTWLSAFTISFSCVMRADLKVGSVITFPPIAALAAITNTQSESNVRAKNAFSGTWTISNMRHIGNSRAPDAQSWVTVFQAYSNNASPASTSVANSAA